MSSGSPSQIVHDVGARARQPEKPPHRQVDELALQIVKRGVDRCACRPLTGSKSMLDRLECKRVVTE
jgi:hypothetical protein